VLQLIVDGLQAGTLTEPQLIPPPHAPIFHALADLRQQFEPLGKGGLLRCLPTKLFVFSYDMASDTLWERDETPSYRKKSAHCSRRAKSFDAAQCTLAGVELIHMIKKRQLVVEAEDERSHCGRTILRSGRLIPSPPVTSHPKAAICQKLRQIPQKRLTKRPSWKSLLIGVFPR
jgi:hypothetical protein